MRSKILDELSYSDQTNEKSLPIRSFFPETWLWELVPIRYASSDKKQFYSDLFVATMVILKLLGNSRTASRNGSVVLHAFLQQMA